MIVRYWMSPSPQTIDPSATLIDAVELMRRAAVRRLPVVQSQRLVGMLSRSDLYTLVGPHLLRRESPLTEELRATLRGEPVSQWMTQDPQSCGPNDPLEEAGARLLSAKIGALPVVHDEQLVGIISDSDIFKAFTLIARAGEDSRRICLLVSHAERSQTIADLVALAHDYGVHVYVVVCHDTDRPGEQLVMSRIGGRRTQQLIDRLWQSRMRVLQVI